ncbi:MAG TPA: response regulator, partial [Spirochaetia bacterium]|nr:response regulator [Spirochaetia bacterium]
LLVEDEEAVREMVHRVLTRYGYTVLTASHAREALRSSEKYEAFIHLMITDVVMPGGMSGRDLAERMSFIRPDMRVLYISGYTDSSISQNDVLEPNVAFLQKPFSPEILARKVREVLGK